jgi:hypothetical protein
MLLFSLLCDGMFLPWRDFKNITVKNRLWHKYRYPCYSLKINGNDEEKPPRGKNAGRLRFLRKPYRRRRCSGNL